MAPRIRVIEVLLVTDVVLIVDDIELWLFGRYLASICLMMQIEDN